MNKLTKELETFSIENNFSLDSIRTTFEKILFASKYPESSFLLSEQELDFVRNFLEKDTSLSILKPVDEDDYEYGRDIAADVSKDGPNMYSVEVLGVNVEFEQGAIEKFRKIYQILEEFLYPETHHIQKFLRDNPEGYHWKCIECGWHLDILDSVEKVSRYLLKFKSGNTKKCRTARHPNQFSISENGNILL